MDLERIATLVLLASISIFVTAVAIRMGGRRPRSTGTKSVDGAVLADEYAGAEEPEHPVEEYGYTDGDGYRDGADSDMAVEAEADHAMGMDADAEVGEILPEQDSLALVREEERPFQGGPDNPGDGTVEVATIPYCYRCSRRIDPYRATCPKCGSAVRFRFLGRGMPTAEKKQGEAGYIRPSWRDTP